MAFCFSCGADGTGFAGPFPPRFTLAKRGKNKNGAERKVQTLYVWIARSQAAGWIFDREYGIGFAGPFPPRVTLAKRGKNKAEAEPQLTLFTMSSFIPAKAE